MQQKNDLGNNNTPSQEIETAPESLSRRQIFTAATLGAVAAASPAFGAAATSQTTRKTERDQTAKVGELDGKTAFITGGARGLGLATAEELAKAGANIVLFDIASRSLANVQYPIASKRDLEQAKARIEALGVRCLTVTGDVRELDVQTRAMEQALNSFGSLDIVVANAGISQAGAIEDFSSEQISTVLEINVAGVIKTTQAAVRFMKPQKSGRIVYISSALGRMGNELFPIYTASKWAVIGFAKSAALSYGKFNILCNTVAPGLAYTPLADNDFILRKLMPNDPNPSFAKLSEMLKPGNPIPVGHVDPVDVAQAVLYLCGSGTRRVTGEVLDVSYGSLARSIA
jgi:NAD(P)-dependent dehydrogenase (short-subunit alcohol dehydrogenase family)